MRKILLTLAFLLSMPAFANPIDDQCPQFVVNGAPTTNVEGQYVCYKNYALHYAYKTKTASYVVEHVTKEAISGIAKRKDDFRPDPKIPAKYMAQLSDYAGQPFDRGHLSPAKDNTQNDVIMSESFYLTNMVPQVPNNNRGIWKQLETFVRDSVGKSNDLYVISGTIYEPGYKTIGQDVGIPTKLYKIIIDKNKNKSMAFIFPNTPLNVSDLPKYVTTIREVEKATGVNFNPLLKVNDLLEQQKTEMVSW